MKLSIFILCIAIPLFSSAQSDTVADLKSNKWSTEKPDYFLVLNNQNIKLDKFTSNTFTHIFNKLGGLENTTN